MKQKGVVGIYILIGLIVLTLAGGAYYFGMSQTKIPIPQPQPSVSPTPSIPTTSSGISGKIVLGPTCPVVSTEAEKGCQDKSYQATVVVKTTDGLKEITRFTSDKNGEFRVGLQPGNYLLDPLPGSSRFPFAKPENVEVEPNKFTTITIIYDTGIR